MVYTPPHLARFLVDECMPLDKPQTKYKVLDPACGSGVFLVIHLAELPLFLGLLWSLTATYGVWGAAIAWLLRMTSDTLLMFWFALRLLQPTKVAARMLSSLPVAMLVAVGFGGMLIAAAPSRLAWLGATTVTSFLLILRPALRAMHQQQRQASQRLAAETPPGAMP